ncbi:MAG: hypothetical protein Q8L86_02245 [Vicinamibacterales bacterium]|nr:hypothetical protein [Vicinamibacterales bacterium]
MRRARAWGGGTMALAAILIVRLGAVDAPEALWPEVAAWLHDHAGLSEADQQTLAAGRAVARTVETATASESAAAGAVVIDAPVERFLQEFVTVSSSRRGPGVLAIGVFSDPPIPADLDGLTLTTEDLAALRRCRPGDCDVKLPAAAIGRFRDAVYWGAPSAPAEATAVMRGWLFDRVRAYRGGGNAALGFADDRRPPTDLGGELAALLSHEPWLEHLAPGVRAYLAGYPGLRPVDVHDTLYWARVDFGLKPTIRLNHVSVHATPNAPAGLTHVIATKQIYASHYLRAALELRLIFARPGGGFVLAMATRSRNDGMTGMLGFVVRAKVRSRSRDGLVRYLEHMKATLEAGRRGGVVGP